MSKGMSSLVERLGEIGFERTRRAVAALALSLFVSLYLLISFNAPPGWSVAFLALGACYLVAFMAVAAEWFWGRWFASGMGWSGVMVAIASLVMMGWTPPLAIYGLLHALVVLPLAGRKMAARYDLQEAWRTRYGMDDLGVARLRRTVTRASASLPSVILWALGPKTDALWGFASRRPELAWLGGLGALVLVAVGLRGVIRLRSWGLLAFAAAGALVAAFGHFAAFATPTVVDFGPLPALFAFATSTMAVILLAAAVAPFVGPAARFLRRRS
jgi:hypothetical protein